MRRHMAADRVALIRTPLADDEAVASPILEAARIACKLFRMAGNLEPPVQPHVPAPNPRRYLTRRRRTLV